MEHCHSPDFSLILLGSGRTKTFMLGCGVTQEKQQETSILVFLDTDVTKLRTDWESKDGWHAPRWVGAETNGFLSSEPFRLRACMCPDTKEFWFSKEALGKPSASLYPYPPFPAQHPRGSADAVITTQNWVPWLWLYIIIWGALFKSPDAQDWAQTNKVRTLGWEPLLWVVHRRSFLLITVN